MPPFVLTALFDIAGKLFDRLIPDPAAKAAAQMELLKMQQSGELAALAAETDLAKGQLDVNKAEASSGSLFVAGWRPAVGWVCVASLAYQFVLRPLGTFAAAYFNHPIPALPGLDETLWQLLFGMLGLGGLRTVEKIRGVASK